MQILDKVVLYVLMALSFAFLTACKYTEASPANHQLSKVSSQSNTNVIVGAQRVGLYYPMLEGKKVAVVVNQTSMVGQKHLVDTMLNLNINITKIFAPEHGFRGEADAGQSVSDGVDPISNLPIVSLYGDNKKPTEAQLSELEAVVFDIQDVGARFYTYISTLHYVMEACAESNIPVIVLDRPNPNAHYVDGPVLEKKFQSFVGMHPVPVVYGMTIGEYAKMINGEQWLANGVVADLTVIACNNYNHNTFYDLPIKPSPNLPNIRSILLYPSLCFFEGTTVSVGRGTDQQFQIYGHPHYDMGTYVFTPVSSIGAKYPKHENKECSGHNLQNATIGSLRDRGQIDLTYLIDMNRQLSKSGHNFFNSNNFFEKLAGTNELRSQLSQGMSEQEIRDSWQPGISKFLTTRSKYLIYEEESE